MFSRRDLAWLRSSDYGLIGKGGSVSGRLHFDMAYNPVEDTFRLNPEPEYVLKPGIIHHADDYEIQIIWEGGSWPVCREVSTKIADTIKKRGLDPVDLHLSDGDQFCLGTPQDLSTAFSRDFSLEQFLERFVIPYLFQQTHYRKKQEWAWRPSGHYSAGVLGWYHYHGNEAKALEMTVVSLADQWRITPKQVVRMIRQQAYSSDMPCKCESGAAVIACCPEAMYGYNRLRLDLEEVST